MSYGQPTPPKVRKHLMTPGQPRPQRAEPMSLGRVQRWVLSMLAATTIMHLSGGLVVAAVFSDKEVSRIGLLVIAGAFGIIAIAAALLIHRRSPFSPWLLLGLVPAAIGAYFVFR
jgi:hypothetical protein